MLRLYALPWVFLATASYVFLAPNVDLAADLQWHDGQRIGQLVLLAAICFSLAWTRARSGLSRSWMLLPTGCRTALLGAFGLGLFSALSSPLPRWALLEWGMLWLLLILALLIAAQRRSDGALLDRWLVLLFFSTAAAYSVTSIVVYLTMLEIGPFFNVRELYGGFSNVRFFGHIQTMMLPFLLLPAMWWGTTPGRRAMLWTVPVIWWMLVVASGTRGTWAALFIGAIAVAIFSGVPGRRWIKCQLSGLIGGLLSYGIFIWAFPQLLEQPSWFIHRSGDIVSLSHRELLWSASMAFSAQHPLLGIGPMHYAYYSFEVAAHPHSLLLQWLAEWGIPASVLLTYVLARGGLMFALHVRQEATAAQCSRVPIEVALLAALTGAAAQAMVDGVLVMPVSQTLLALLCGWAMGIYFEKSKDALRYPAFRHLAIILLTIMAAGLVGRGVAPEIGRIAERERNYLAAHPPVDPSLPRLFPRYWTQGWIHQ